MNILVTAASRHGGTWGIAQMIAQHLEAAGGGVTLADLQDVKDLDGFDAAVIGSAIYWGRWLPIAGDFVRTHAADLSSIPVWLFSSGALGADDRLSRIDPSYIEQLVTETGAREHLQFAGALAPDGLSTVERLVAKAVHAPIGDFRDRDAIAMWAREIACSLDLTGCRSTLQEYTVHTRPDALSG